MTAQWSYVLKNKFYVAVLPIKVFTLNQSSHCNMSWWIIFIVTASVNNQTYDSAIKDSVTLYYLLYGTVVAKWKFLNVQYGQDLLFCLEIWLGMDKYTFRILGEKRCLGCQN